ncbi:MAG: response regulator [Chloroflexota bacterium]
MQQQLKVVILDDDPTTIRHIEGYVASAGYRSVVVPFAGVTPQQLVSLHPDVILLRVPTAAHDKAMALGRSLTLSLPQSPIIMYGPAPDTALLQNSMVAGARRFLTIPFPRDVLLRAIADTRAQIPSAAHVSDLGTSAGSISFGGALLLPDARAKLVTVFSPKGGVGTTTLAVNLAVGLQQRQQRTALVDANISCGNVGVFLNINPTSSILDLVASGQHEDARTVRAHLLEHQTSGIEVLLSPIQAEQGEAITGEHLRAIFGLLQEQFDYVVVDTTSSYEDRVLVSLELADTIVVPIAPDLAAVRNLVSFLRILRLLGHDEERLLLVLMRSNSVPPSQVKDIERFLGRTFDVHVVSDGRRTTQAINEGTPVVTRHPDSRLATDLLAIADRLTNKTGGKARSPEPARGLLRRGSNLIANRSGSGNQSGDRAAPANPR